MVRVSGHQCLSRSILSFKAVETIRGHSTRGHVGGVTLSTPGSASRVSDRFRISQKMGQVAARRDDLLLGASPPFQGTDPPTTVGRVGQVSVTGSGLFSSTLAVASDAALSGTLQVTSQVTLSANLGCTPHSCGNYR